MLGPRWMRDSIFLATLVLFSMEGEGRAASNRSFSGILSRGGSDGRLDDDDRLLLLLLLLFAVVGLSVSVRGGLVVVVAATAPAAFVGGRTIKGMTTPDDDTLFFAPSSLVVVASALASWRGAILSISKRDFLRPSDFFCIMLCVLHNNTQQKDSGEFVLCIQCPLYVVHLTGKRLVRALSLRFKGKGAIIHFIVHNPVFCEQGCCRHYQ